MTKLGHDVMLAFKPIPSHLGDVGSNHDDRDHRTQATDAVVVGMIAAIVLSICLILLVA